MYSIILVLSLSRARSHLCVRACSPSLTVTILMACATLCLLHSAHCVNQALRTRCNPIEGSPPPSGSALVV